MTEELDYTLFGIFRRAEPLDQMQEEDYNSDKCKEKEVTPCE